MSAATARRTTGLVALLLLAAGAWALSAARMDGMDAGPATDLGTLAWFTATWLLMMAAMMFPSLAPALPAQVRAAAPFVAGYLLAWTSAGAAAYALIEAVRAFELGVLAWDEGGRYVAGGVIAAAGLYELTPLKDTCLRRCRAQRAVVRPRGHLGMPCTWAPGTGWLASAAAGRLWRCYSRWAQ